MPTNLSFKSLILFSVFASFISNANNYTLTITDAKHHLADAEVDFTDIRTKALTVKLPVWRSGRYEILDLSANIRDFKAFDTSGKSLTWHQDDKNSWRIFVNTPGTVKVTYQVYANQLRDRVSHIDETHAYLDASGVFMYSPSQRDKALTVKLNVPKQWQSVSGMESIGEHQFKADNYDQLVDSPIESGVHQFDSIKVEAQTYEIVIWGKGNYDMQRLKNDIEKLHYQAKALWKTFPYTRYVYMYHVGDKLRGATEHVNSTIIQTDRLGFAPDKKYRKVIGTTAHEFIHTWNVKSYRPAGISPYDYDKENYSDLFWMAEGTTSYYDNLFNVRAGIYTTQQYLENMAKDINTFKSKPGRKVMSLSQSSFNTWLNNNTNRRHNTTVSIYLKGSLVSWLLDKEIRATTNNKKSLDDLSLKLFQKYGKSKQGYTSYNVKQLLKEITNKDFSEFWNDYVEGIKTIDFDDLLNFYGLTIKPAKKDDAKKVTIGWKTKTSNNITEISLVDTDGAAFNAGLAAGDEIIAIDNMQIKGNLAEIIESLKTDQSYTVHYFNQGIIKQTSITPQVAPPDKLKIIAVKKPTKAQKQHFKSWIKQDIKSAFKNDK
jgi:predicted metalloprotease with PDZ domain